jgi:hypothetical protein
LIQGHALVFEKHLTRAIFSNSTNRRDGMTFKTILTAAALTLASAAGAYAMCADKQHAMSCGAGMTYDATDIAAYR